MTIDNLVERISETQDGNALTKFYRECRATNGTVLWHYWDNLDEMSVGDVLNLLLLKIAEKQDQDERESDIGYVVQQLERAKTAINASVYASPTQPVPAGGKVMNIFEATGTCPICHEPDHDFDCR